MKKLFLALMAVATIALTGCEKKPDGTSGGSSEKVKTISATDITTNSALLTGQIGVEIADYKSIEFGMLISEKESDVSSYIGKRLVGNKLLGQTFSITANSLLVGSKYYYRAYLVLNNMQHEYGEVKSFILPLVPSKDVKAIDLGLSVKWANMNIGSTEPEDYGAYLAWGETSPKTIYYWSTYKHMQSGKDRWEYITKYTFPDGRKSGIWYNGDTFIGDNKTVLDLADDAAHVNWGGSWRMPTKEEFYELLNNCTWTWTTKKGIEGYLVKSKKNSNSIFLPASGFRGGSSYFVVGSDGYYWSSSLDSFNSQGSCYASYVYFYSDCVKRSSNSRSCGFSVRPVCQ